jgi:predicted metal-binding membrane protein/peroxiredoxin
MVAVPSAIDYGDAGVVVAPASPSIGARVPRFAALLATDGHRYGLAEFADKDIVVLVFSSNRCPTAKNHTQRLNDFAAAYGQRGVQLILINSNDPHLYPAESHARMVELADDAGYTFPYLADPDQRVAADFGAKCTFHAFVLDRDRRLRYEGRFDDARVAANVTTTDVADAVDDLLAGRDVHVVHTAPFGCSLDIMRGSSMSAGSLTGFQPVLWAFIGVAWLAMAVAQLTGVGALLHHGALIENGPSLPIAAAASTIGFMVMTVGMMLPGSLRAVGSYASDFERSVRRLAVPRFLVGYFAIWALFGLVCFFGDTVVHRLVDSSPWLAQHAYLVAAGVFAIAGVYQWLPVKDRCLASCRNPLVASHRGSAAIAAGGAHAIDCVMSSGPLMLLMFAAGIANVGWMLALAALMAYESVGRNSRFVCRAAGVVLLFTALLIMTTPAVANLLAS